LPKLDKIKFGQIKPGTKISKGEILFKKVEFAAQDLFTKLNLRCALIEDVRDIEGADKLYELSVNLGGLGKRTLVAGIKKIYKKEELKGKKIALIANLEPATICGVKSEGMILAAEHKGQVEAVLLQKTLPGEKIFAEGLESEPATKVSFDEFSKINLIVKNGKILYKNKCLQSGKEILSVKLKEGKVQ